MAPPLQTAPCVCSEWFEEWDGERMDKWTHSGYNEVLTVGELVGYKC